MVLCAEENLAKYGLEVSGRGAKASTQVKVTVDIDKKEDEKI